MRAARVVGVVALLGASAAPALADPPPDLVRQITDLNGGLADGEDELRSALAALDTEDGIELYVVSVDSTDGQDVLDWGDEAAIDSFLTDDQPVLVLATEDDDYALSVGEEFELSDDEVDLVLDAVEGPFSQGDYAGAGEAAAQKMQELAGGGLSPWWVVGGVGALAAAGAGVALSRRRRSGSTWLPDGGTAVRPHPATRRAGRGAQPSGRVGAGGHRRGRARRGARARVRAGRVR